MSILNQLAGAYGLDVSRYTTVDSRSAIVRGLLANKRALLVLDNAESSDQVTPCCRPAPALAPCCSPPATIWQSRMVGHSWKFGRLPPIHKMPWPSLPVFTV